MNSTNTDENGEPFALKMVLRLCFVIVFVIGLCGNLLVCIVMIQQRRMRTVMNCFTLNLAISDLIIIVIYVPSQYAAYENNQNWPFGNAGCRLTYSIVPASLSASIGTMLAISCERFRGIVFPFKPRLTLTTVRRIILIIWIVSITTALPLMIIAGTIRKGNNTFCDELWRNPASSRFYWVAMFVLQYVLPLIIMSILYGVAGWKLQKRSKFLSRNSRGRAGSINYNVEIARQRQSQKITKMLVALILIYSFCMLPQHVVYFWSTYGTLREWKYFLYVFRISNVFTMANSALNSIVYGTLQTDFRKAYGLFFLKYNFCSCTENKREDSNREKPYNKIAFRLKQKDTLETQVNDKIKSSPTSEQENNSTLNKTPLRRRLSSDSRSPLISADSTSESQHSKNSDGQKENIDKKIILKQDGIKLKELRNWDEHTNTTQDGKTTHVKVFLKKESQSRDSNQQRQNGSIIETHFKLGDIFLLDNSKETVL